MFEIFNTVKVFFIPHYCKATTLQGLNKVDRAHVSMLSIAEL